MAKPTSAARALFARQPHLRKIFTAARARGPLPVAVAYPCDRDALEAAVTAAREGLILPTLVGPRTLIEAAAAKARLDLAGAAIHDTGDDPRGAAVEAVALCRSGAAAALMKGSLHTDELMGAVVPSATGLRTARRISHVFVIDIPKFERPLLLTDCVVNINPALLDKRDITQNAIDLAHTIGIARPHAASIRSSG